MEPQSDAKKFATEGILTALDDGNRDVEILSDEQTEEYLKMIGADTETQFSIDTDKPIFISNAARAVAGIKQEKATPEQWLKMIEKAGGLKAGEDKWIGLSDWLKASDKKTLTKQEVLDFINENTIRIEEVSYRHWEDLDYIDEATRILEAEMREIGWDAMVEKYPNFDQLFEESNGELLWSENTAPISEYDKFIFDDHNILERPIHETREKYTSAGLENNREIAIVVPTIEPWKKYDELHFGDAGYGRAVAWVRFGEAKAYVKEYADFYAYQKEMQQKYFPERAISSLSGSDLESLTSDERAEFERLRDIAKSIPFAKRISRRVLVIDEIQSKRHQDGREWGYKSDFNSADEEEQRILRELDAKNARMAELIREREEEGQQQRIRMAQIHSMLDFVRSNQEYDALLQEAEEIKTKVNNRSTEINNLRYELRRLESLLTYNRIERADRQKSAVPDAPFDKNWHELAMKRMLRYAAENGYDAVAWTKGEQQAERYSLAKSFNGIEREDRPDGEGGRR
ncbi:MAG: hypothetical protein IIV12_00835, partial [Bacteroidales bacterium]|nr:hypothetical protein [Bacteroidales bacterium]